MRDMAGFRSWLAKGCEEIAETVIAGIEAYEVQRRAERFKKEPGKVKHIQGWLTEKRWEGFEVATSPAEPKSERKLQIMAVRLDLEKGLLDRAKRWWRSLEEIPADIAAEARRLMSEQLRQAA